MKRMLIIVLASLLFSLSVGADSFSAPKGFAGKMWNSTFALYASLGKAVHFDCTAEPIGKIPGGYRLLTAGHCVQEIPSGAVFFVSEQIEGTLTPVTLVKAYEGQGEDPIDFAVFDLKTEKKYNILDLDLTENVRIGDKTINPSFALALGKQVSYGQVSSQPIIKSEECHQDGCLGNFLVQEYSGPGASGSPVISLRTHKVIGILVYQFDGDVGFAVEPISRFSIFLAAPVQPHPEPEDVTQIIIRILGGN